MDYQVPNFYKTPKDSIFDKEYDYIVSLGHRCCVGQALNYMRKSSFPLDWQITPIDVLPNLFRNEFKDIYPDSGVKFVHTLHNPDTNELDVEKTTETFNRRSSRLVKLIRENKRKLLFVRHKYIWYWSQLQNHINQNDNNSIKYDIAKLSDVSSTLTSYYNNTNFDILYIYQDITQFGKLPANESGVVQYKDFVMPGAQEQIDQAKQFTYVEQYGYKDMNITPVIVYPGNVRVEGNAMCSCINSFVKLTDIQDFELPYGFEKKILTRNIDLEII